MWSADASERLEESLRGVFQSVDVLPQEVRLQDRDEHYWLYVARVPSDS